MEKPSHLDQQFSDAYNEANDAYRADRLDECESKLRELLDEPVLPRYYRMKSLVLLGLILGDWKEANKCYIAGDAL
jgi:predicted Zn-dependent protease